MDLYISWPNVVLLLAHNLRRSLNIKPEFSENNQFMLVSLLAHPLKTWVNDALITAQHCRNAAKF